MTTLKPRESRPKAAPPKAPAQRKALWLPGAMVVLVLGGTIAGVWALNRPHPTSVTTPVTTPAPAAAPVASSAIPAQIRQRVLGRWLRPDGGYVLTIESLAEDGQITATYANPRPIHVEKARAAQQDGRTLLYVELRDRGYPGNYYVLAFDPARDQLVGMYYHLGIQQQFEVYFERLK